MSSYFGNSSIIIILKWRLTSACIDELGINTKQNKKKTYDVDLDAFMNPESGSVYSGFGDTQSNVQQLIQTAK